MTAAFRKESCWVVAARATLVLCCLLGATSAAANSGVKQGLRGVRRLLDEASEQTGREEPGASFVDAPASPALASAGQAERGAEPSGPLLSDEFDPYSEDVVTEEDLRDANSSPAAVEALKTSPPSDGSAAAVSEAEAFGKVSTAESSELLSDDDPLFKAAAEGEPFPATPLPTEPSAPVQQQAGLDAAAAEFLEGETDAVEDPDLADTVERVARALAVLPGAKLQRTSDSVLSSDPPPATPSPVVENFGVAGAATAATPDSAAAGNATTTAAAGTAESNSTAVADGKPGQSANSPSSSNAGEVPLQPPAPQLLPETGAIVLDALAAPLSAPVGAPQVPILAPSLETLAGGAAGAPSSRRIGFPPSLSGEERPSEAILGLKGLSGAPEPAAGNKSVSNSAATPAAGKPAMGGVAAPQPASTGVNASSAEGGARHSPSPALRPESGDSEELSTGVGEARKQPTGGHKGHRWKSKKGRSGGGAAPGGVDKAGEEDGAGRVTEGRERQGETLGVKEERSGETLGVKEEERGTADGPPKDERDWITGFEKKTPTPAGTPAPTLTASESAAADAARAQLAAAARMQEQERLHEQRRADDNDVLVEHGAGSDTQESHTTPSQRNVTALKELESRVREGDVPDWLGKAAPAVANGSHPAGKAGRPDGVFEVPQDDSAYRPGLAELLWSPSMSWVMMALVGVVVMAFPVLLYLKFRGPADRGRYAAVANPTQPQRRSQQPRGMVDVGWDSNWDEDGWELTEVERAAASGPGLSGKPAGLRPGIPGPVSGLGSGSGLGLGSSGADRSEVPQAEKPARPPKKGGMKLVLTKGKGGLPLSSQDKHKA